jgi:hypothetical protein
MPKYPWITLWELLAQVRASGTHVICRCKVEQACLPFRVLRGSWAKYGAHACEMKLITHNEDCISTRTCIVKS